MTTQCIIVTATGVCEYKVDVDPLDTFTPPSGYSVAPDNTGDIGDTWTGSAWTVGSPGSDTTESATSYALGNGNQLEFFSNSTRRATLDSNGRLIFTADVSNQSLPVGIGIEPKVQIPTTGTDASLSILRHSADALAPYLVLGKSRATTEIASDEDAAAVQSGDALGRISFVGSLGAPGSTAFLNEAAQIVALASATFAAGSTPAHLDFRTTPSGAITPTTRMRIASSGEVVIGNPTTVTPNGLLHINNTGSGNTILIEDASAPDSTPWVVDASGKQVIGYTAPITGLAMSSAASQSANFAVIGSSQQTSMQSFYYAANSASSAIVGHKSRTTTVGAHSAVSSGDNALAIVGAVSDGSAWGRVADILLAADDNATSGATPGRILLRTTPAASTTPSDRMSIDKAGDVGIGTTSPATRVHMHNRTSDTNVVRSILTLEHASSGTVAAGFGTGISLLAESLAGEAIAMASIAGEFTTVTASAEVSDVVIKAMTAGALAEVLRVKGGQTVNLNGTQILKTRRTGWALPTGTPTRTTFNTATVTLAQLAERVYALIDDMHATNGHGLIGT